LNFAILLGGLGWLAKKYGGPYFQERTDSIRGGIADATRVREEAEARAAEIERKVANLSVEVARLREQSKAEIAREGERVAGETAAQIAKIQAQAHSEIASAAKHATLELRAYSAKLAVELATRQIRDRVTPQVQENLTEAFVTELNSKTVVN
jgi:F-type H+-transporting ATPase subunit b